MTLVAVARHLPESGDLLRRVRVTIVSGDQYSTR